MERKDELEGLKNFCKNTSVVVAELYIMLQQSGLEQKVQDANWRVGDIIIMCEEIVKLCDGEK